MHIRRTDKLTENDFISVEKYFTAAEEFFNASPTRKVFAASIFHFYMKLLLSKFDVDDSLIQSIVAVHLC